MTTMLANAVRTPAAAVDLVKRWEGLEDGDPSTVELDPYLCPTGYATVGWGHVVLDPRTGEQLRGRAGLIRAREVLPHGISRDDAELLLAGDLERFVAAVDRAAGAALACELGAMTSLAFNVGIGGFGGSTVARQHRSGDIPGAGDAFRLWNKGTVNGARVVLQGLVRRREHERAVYLGAPRPAVPSFRVEAAIGAKGSDVRALQERLNVFVQPRIVVDGEFGPRTRSAVAQFQRLKGLVADGIVGPKTIAALNV